MQPANNMSGPPQQQQYQQQQPPPQQQHWMAQQQPATYQVPPPQQSGYYYQQPQQPQYNAAAAAGGGGVAAAQPTSSDEIRSLWIGDLQFWMDEQYIQNCFVHTGEVVSAKVIRNKQSGQSEGYGFVEFVSHAAAERNLQAYNGTVMPNSEQPFRLNWASLGSGEKRSDNGPEHTIFVGDLAADVTDYMLQETFRVNYPSVKGAKVVTDRVTGRTKGYGFVKFADENEQLHAMTEMNGKFCSTRPMRTGPAANKKSVPGQVQASYQSTNGTQNEDDPTNTTIFVGNLDANVSDDHLRQVFSNYGQLLHVKIPVGKRCGFVQFADRSCAEEALRALSGTQLGGQTIRLSWGRSPSNKQQPQADPNQYGGYYGYTAGYDAAAAYGYAQPAQDPNLYYGGYAGYGNYPPQQQPPQ
ncbi:polyadenylate-binding protein RBP45 [Capsicum annuum]